MLLILNALMGIILVMLKRRTDYEGDLFYWIPRANEYRAYFLTFGGVARNIADVDFPFLMHHRESGTECYRDLPILWWGVISVS
jgi:hypothetical protein